MQSVVDVEELGDVENVNFLENSPKQRLEVEDEREDAIFSKPPLSENSGNSSPVYDFDLFSDFLTSVNEDDKEDVSITDSLVDCDSLELSDYLIGGKTNNAKMHGRRMVTELDLLERREQQTPTIQTHVLVPVKDIENKTYLKRISPLIVGDGDTDSQSMSKNAIAARENRLKKKQYLTHLENTVKSLSEENRKLKSSEILKDSEIEKLRAEIKYLNNVLANQSTISALLKNIHKTPGVRFTDSYSMPSKIDIGDKSNQVKATNDVKRLGILKRKLDKPPENILMESSLSKMRRLRSNSCSLLKNNAHDEEDTIPQEQYKCDNDSGDFSGGICLHVTGEKVSLEFCAQCNLKSNSSLISSDHCYVRQRLQ